MKEKKTVLSLILFFLILNALDFVLTVSATQNEKGIEANPFMAGLIESSISAYTAVKISAGIIIALLLFKLYKKHLRAARITAAFLVIAYVFIVSNNVIINASAVVIGSNVGAVGGGYSNFYSSEYYEFVYWTSDNGGQIRIVALDKDGLPVSDTILVTNITGVKSVCIGKDGYVYFSVDDSNNNYDGIWRRNTKATNPLNWPDMKSDSNYFVHIASDIGLGLTPSGNRIYYFVGTTVKYISGASVSVLYDVGGNSIQDLSATVDYIYVLKKAGWNKLNIVLLTHDGELVQEKTIRGYSCSVGSFGFSSALLVFSDYIINTNKVSSQYCGNYAESFKIELYANKTVNTSAKTSISALTSQTGYEMAEIAYSPFGVYINGNKQATIFLAESEYIPEPKPTPTPPPDGDNPDGTNAITVKIDGYDADGTTLSEGKHKITVEDAIYGSKLEGAEIYVDGNYVGKTEKPSLWMFPNPFADPELEYAFTAGTHTVKAVYNNLIDTMTVKVLSGILITVFVDGEGADGLSLTPGEHTIKVRDGYGNAIDGAEIYINGEFVGKTGTPSLWIIPNPFAEPELKYNFQTAGNYTVKAYYKAAEDTILVNVTSSGVTSSAIVVKFDGESQDGLTFFVGKHTITVEDSSGNAIDGAEIYINGEYVGKTSKSWWIWDTPKLEYEFTDGSYTIKAFYDNMEDTITVTIQGVDPSNPDAVILFAIKDSNKGCAIIGNFTVDRGEKVCFVVAKQKDVNSIWDWDRISGAQVYINGQPVGITKKTDFMGFEIPFLGHFGGEVGYVHVFDESGTYEVYATGDFGTTQKLYVTVGNTTADTSPTSPVEDFLEGISNNMPITGNETIDMVIWAIILLFVGVVIVVLLLTLLRALV